MSDQAVTVQASTITGVSGPLFLSYPVIVSAAVANAPGNILAYITGGSSSGGFTVQDVALAAGLPVTSTQGTLTDRSGTITSGGTAQQLAAANSSRKYLFIQNNSSGNLWFNFTTTAVQSQPSILLLPNASVTFVSPFITTEAVSIIGATTSQSWSAKES
jgi:hypothetical protein